MARLIVGPFNRVEGDLEVTLDIADGAVAAARVNAPMYRGFETMLQGKAPHDALVIVPRICGICSVSQTVAAARALASLGGLGAPGGPAMPANGQHLTNLVLATENLADHLTHFYLFFLPDFTRPAYAGRPWLDEARRRFAPGGGTQQRAAIAARQRWFTLLGTLAGHWPHTQSLEPGGSARPVDAAERTRLLAKVREFRGFLERQLFGLPLEAVAAWSDEAAMLAWWAAQPPHAGSDFALWLTIALDARLQALGRGPGRTLSFGAYPDPDTPAGHALAAGVFDEAGATLHPVDVAAIREDATHAWLHDADGPLHPAAGRTRPDADKPGGYTWNKAPRLAGQVVETGAIARQLASGQPLVRDLVARHGATVYTRVLARLLELARVVQMMEAWLQALAVHRPGAAGAPWCVPVPLPEAGFGTGLSEAARGALGHWVELRHGRIANWQIVAPTSWNFSPRDAAGTPGALEQALVGAPVDGAEATPVAVQHIVRSFDPCMVCTVH